MRKILIGFGVLIAVVLAVALYLVFNMDSVVHSRIERTGTRIAGVPVTVGTVEISLAAGTATVTDLSVANPPGFSDQPAMHFGQISATINVVTGVISRVLAVRPVIRVEGAPERTNIDVLRANAVSAERTAGDGTTGASQGTNATSGDTTTQTTGQSSASTQVNDEDESTDTYVFNLVEVEQAGVRVDLDGLESPLQVDVDRIAFENLSGTRSEITEQILDQLTRTVMVAVRERLRDVATEELRNELERRSDDLETEARERLKDLFN